VASLWEHEGLLTLPVKEDPRRNQLYPTNVLYSLLQICGNPTKAAAVSKNFPLLVSWSGIFFFGSFSFVKDG
jgi:hypothetical protein